MGRRGVSGIMLKSIIKQILRFDIDNTVFIALLTTGSLWLALAPDATTGLIVGLLWIIALLALVSGLGGFVSSHPCGAPTPPRPGLLKRLIYWAGAAALAAAAAALFAAGHTVLATVVAIHLFGRLFAGFMAAWPYLEQEILEIAEGESAARRKLIRYEVAAIAAGIVIVAGPLWIAFDAPPGWAVSLIVTAWWVALLAALLIFSSALRSLVDNPLPFRLASQIFRIGDASAERGGIPEIAGSRLLTVYFLFVSFALAAAGMTVPAGLAVLLLLLGRAESAQRELVEAADAGKPHRLGWFSRANHFIVTNAVLLIFSPVRHTSRLLGIGAALEAAELREAFDRPDGFIYFLWSESLQRVPYLEQGGLLEPYAEHVVERNWRRDIMEGVDGAGGKAAAERRLLARYDVLRKGTPFLVIVPPKGCPRAVRLAGRGIRRWWTGDLHAQTIKFSVLSAVTKAFGPGAR